MRRWRPVTVDNVGEVSRDARGVEGGAQSGRRLRSALPKGTARQAETADTGAV